MDAIAEPRRFLTGGAPWVAPKADPKKPGVYAIISPNGKRYIGSAARCIRIRWNQHRHLLRRRQHDNSYLQKAWNKYGESAFRFEALLNCAPEWCICSEQIQIQRFDATNRERGYNLAPMAGSNLGFKHSAESKEKISKVQRGRILSPEALASIRAARAKMKGIPRPPEVIAKMMAGLKAALTPEYREGIRQRNLARTPEQIAGNARRANSPEILAKRSANFKPLAPEVYAKISSARWSGDAHEKMSVALSGKKKTPEHVAALKEAWKKRGPVSDAARQKMRASRLAYLKRQLESEE